MPTTRPGPRKAALWLLDKAPAPLVERVAGSPTLKRVLRPLVNRAVPRADSMVTVRGGLCEGMRLRIDPQAQKYYWTGLYEPAVQDALRASLRPGMTFWDVGGHLGFISLAASRLVGEQGRVVTFEPVPENRERLIEHVRLNGVSNIEVAPLGLAADPGEAVLSTPGFDLSATWSLHDGGDAGRTISIELSTLDEQTAAFPDPDVIKIDVEGAELDVLRGGRQLMERRRPVVIVEVLDPSRIGDVEELLPGYATERLDATNLVMRPSADG